MKRSFLFCMAFFLFVSTFQLRSEWFDLNLRCQYPQVWFFDKNNGFLGCWRSEFIANTAILFSTNGGETWDTSLKVLNYAGSPSLFSDIYFYNKKYGWLLDWGFNLIWRTTDSGKTWTFSEDCYATGMLGKMSFVDSLYGWIVYSYYIDKTTDGGETFIHLVESNWAIPDSLRERYQDVFFVNRNLGWVVGTFGRKYILIKKTTDGGLSWKTFVDSTLDGTLLGTYFFDSLNGWAVGTKGLILKTTDGGESWKRIDLGLSEELILSDIRFLNSNVGYIVGGKRAGEYGLILRTDDGGKTWVRQFTPVKDYCYSICIVDSLTAWITGSYSIIKTTDGGYSFQTIVFDGEGLAENKMISQLFSDEFWLSFDDDFREATLLLYNSLGELLLQKEILLSEFGKKYFIETKNFPSGVYFLVIRSNQKTKVHKVILLR